MHVWRHGWKPVHMWSKKHIILSWSYIMSTCNACMTSRVEPGYTLVTPTFWVIPFLDSVIFLFRLMKVYLFAVDLQTTVSCWLVCHGDTPRFLPRELIWHSQYSIKVVIFAIFLFENLERASLFLLMLSTKQGNHGYLVLTSLWSNPVLNDKIIRIPVNSLPLYTTSSVYNNLA